LLLLEGGQKQEVAVYAVDCIPKTFEVQTQQEYA
jgi:hypothetical protein